MTTSAILILFAVRFHSLRRVRSRLLAPNLVRRPFVSFPLLLKYRTHLVLWYPLFSHTLRNRTRSPDAVNMGTESRVRSGLLHAFLSFSVGMGSTSADSVSSLSP